MFSHSRVELFERCPLSYKLKYLEGVEITNNNEANNPLIIGTALHKGVEGGNYEKYYKSNFPIIQTEHYMELLKLDFFIPKVRTVLLGENKYTFEYKLECDEFIGFIDLLIKKSDGTYAIYDFKYSNKSYKNSRQLHIYKYYFEKITGNKVSELNYILVPKLFIRLKKTETLELFRQRLINELKNTKIKIENVEYDELKVREYHSLIQQIKLTNFKEIITCCDNEFCDYCNAIKKGENYMFKLPENKRRDISEVTKRTIWIYGAPMSGKTTFTDKFPDVLMLNTDGNIKFVTAPYVSIKNDVEVEGRLVKTTSGWQNFKDAIFELEKKQNNFKTIVVDLLEDTYELCRLHMYDKLNITHESDDSFRAWDKVRTEYLSTIKRLLNLDYENIILISHEDTSKDIMNKAGGKITSIKPNIQEKLANKIAGMVDLVARCVKDNDSYVLSFNTSDVIFGGGRIKLNVSEIPLDYDEFVKIYGVTEKDFLEDMVNPFIEEEKEVVEEEKIRRRRRKEQ